MTPCAEMSVQEEADLGEQWCELVRLLQVLQAEDALSVSLAVVISEHILANLRQLLPEKLHAVLRDLISDQRDPVGLGITLRLQRFMGNPRVTRGLLLKLLGLVGLRAQLMPTVQDAWLSMLLRDGDPEVRKRRQHYSTHIQQYVPAQTCKVSRHESSNGGPHATVLCVSRSSRWCASRSAVPMPISCSVVRRSVWWRCCPQERHSCQQASLRSSCRRRHATAGHSLE